MFLGVAAAGKLWWLVRALGGTGSLSESLYWSLSVIIFKVEIRANAS
ncbi:hypothetical protein [Ligilactobacillus salivarius]|uniref:Uncharacterized protein n=1 Tax=Ligilactobacillus salivarius TaxID=1624 RepID=A0AAX3XBN6_9LACO|nr:hypothetical protein [Ligilactobacillus salivarius]WII29710.1 hypothetical protein QFE45_10605 [Ligilactobacillus salivarius]